MGCCDPSNMYEKVCVVPLYFLYYAILCSCCTPELPAVSKEISQFDHLPIS